MNAPAALSCRGLGLGYDGSALILSDVDLDVGAGEVLALLGPSGSGKTTLLHAVAGFVAPRTGELWLGGVLASTPRRCLPPERRRVGVVFQNYALWPHLAVRDIVAYPVRRRGVPAAAARDAAGELLDRMGLSDLADRRPAQLSGGEQQRVGLARALAADPALFLFDEPTAHLDAHLRAIVLAEVARRRAEAGAAAVYATHDAAEALAIAGRVAVLHGGGAAQVGTPDEVYRRPVDRTVARLSGPASVLDGAVLDRTAESVTIRAGDRRVTVATSAPPGGGGAAVVRPDWVRLGGDLPATVASVRFAGPHTDIHLDTAAGQVVVRGSGSSRHAPGDHVMWTLCEAWPVP
ncbi:ATP-binding cassette domain-containing protein [Phytohabitans rumicis]|uniref:ATP-binding cassette domain-containing protein n=1 Tax=Phytohabitans rumicis TaxID=1076125 RepID=UPI001566730F